jgi:hypothetical protein
MQLSGDWMDASGIEPVPPHARFLLEPGSVDTQKLVVPVGPG